MSVPVNSEGDAHLKCCVLLWPPSYKQHIDKLEEFQERAMEVTKGLQQGGTYKKRLRELGFLSLRKAKRRHNCCSQLHHEGIQRRLSDLFSVVHGRRMRHKRHK